MEILKKYWLSLLVIGLLAQSVEAQNQIKMRDAFKASYQAENAGDYSKAIESLKSVLTKDNYEINLRLGWLNYKAGLFDKSEAYYQKSIQIMPYSIEARFGLIYPLSSLGKWPLVIKTYKAILEIDPHNSLANFRFGLVHYGRSEYVEAEKLFTKVVNLYPFDYDGVHMLAWTKLKLGKTQEAEALFNKALLYSPDDASSLEGLSLIK